MAQNYQTPGVYVVEQNAFPNSVVAVETAIPAFIGYTQTAAYKGRNLLQAPCRIASLKEFETVFGTAFPHTFDLLTPAPAGSPTAHSASPLPLPLSFASEPGTRYALALREPSLFYLYNAIRLFYQNGGATCYIVSIGLYDAANAAAPVASDFRNALEALLLEQDPTMVLCPDALRLDAATYATVVGDVLQHCQAAQSRVALFDVYGGAMSDHKQAVDEPTNHFRNNEVGGDFLKYGIAYFPWVNTTIVSPADVSFKNLTANGRAALATLLAQPVSTATPALNAMRETLAETLTSYAPPATPPSNAAKLDAAQLSLHNALLAASAEYALVLKNIAAYLNTQPVAPAIAGVYTAVDSSRGVWKAPANVGLNAVVSPTRVLSDYDQQALNVDAVTGKSINAIRSFRGQGVLVWGARTLDGNSQDWRYVNVRRTLIMMEQSMKLAMRAYVFEPNDANTWTTVRSMLSSFLFNLWKQGALFGAAPADAYNVAVGLGSTMTADDVLAGFMRVSVLVALQRPAEFIVLTFQQEMSSQ